MSVIGIVLAGGRSSRFGGDKLASELDGETLLEAAIGAVASVADRVVVAGPSLPDGSRAEVPVTLVRDAEPFAGPLVALAGVLSKANSAPSDIAIVAGGDMPSLVPQVLGAMLDRLLEDPPVDAVTLEGTDEGGEVRSRTQVLPVALRVGPAGHAALAAIESGSRSLLSLLERLAHAELPADRWLALDPAAKTLLDVDTSSDLERIRRRLAH